MSSKDSKREKAREVVDILEEISELLNTQLDRAQLSLCISLIENGVNPEGLAVSQTSTTYVSREESHAFRMLSTNYAERHALPSLNQDWNEQFREAYAVSLGNPADTTIATAVPALRLGFKVSMRNLMLVLNSFAEGPNPER